MNHVQAVTVLEATHPDNNNNARDIKSSVIVKRIVHKDSNNNIQQHITKESLNATEPSRNTDHVYDEDDLKEYSLLGIVKFKQPIKWLNTISIVLIHLIFCYGFIAYPLKASFLTTFWGKLRHNIQQSPITTTVHSNASLCQSAAIVFAAERTGLHT